MSESAERYTCDEWDEFKFMVEFWHSRDELGYALITERGAGDRPDSSLGRVNFPDTEVESDDVDDLMYALSEEVTGGADADPVSTFLTTILERITDGMVGLERARFRVKLMGIKGNKHLRSKTLLVVDTHFKPGEAPAAPLPGVGPADSTLTGLQHAGEVRERLDSHDFTRRGQEILLNSIHAVTGMHTQGHQTYRASTESVIQTLRAENEALRNRCHQLTIHIEEMAKSRDQEATRRLEADREMRAIERTVDRTLSVVSDAVQAGIAAKTGIDPELMKTLQIITRNDNLMKALRDPAIREFISDEDMQNELANILTNSQAEYAAALALQQQQQQLTDTSNVPAPNQPAASNGPAEDASEDPPDPAAPEASSPVQVNAAQPAQEADAPTPFNHPVPELPADFLETE